MIVELDKLDEFQEFVARSLGVRIEIKAKGREYARFFTMGSFCALVKTDIGGAELICSNLDVRQSIMQAWRIWLKNKQIENLDFSDICKILDKGVSNGADRSAEGCDGGTNLEDNRFHHCARGGEGGAECCERQGCVSDAAGGGEGCE